MKNKDRGRCQEGIPQRENKDRLRGSEGNTRGQSSHQREERLEPMSFYKYFFL